MGGRILIGISGRFHWNAQPHCVVLARLSIDYLNEATFPDPLKGGWRLAVVSDTLIATHHSIFQRNTCCFVSQ